MSDGAVKRDVILNLLLQSADGNKAAADQVRATVESLVEDMAAGYALAREVAVKEAEKTAAGQISAARAAATGVSRAYGSAAGAATGTVVKTAVVRPPGGISATGTVAIGSGGSSSAAGGSSGGRAGSSQADRDAAAAEKAYDREAAAALKAYSRIMRERDKVAAAAEKALAKQQQQAEKANAAEARAAAKAAADIARERQRLTGVLASSVDQAQQAGNQATKSAAEGAAAVVKIGRGFAEIGLLSESSTEELLRGLVRLQAGFDILTGGIDLYVKLSEAIRAAAKSQQAYASAQAASQALSASGAASNAGKAAGGVVSGAAGAAGAAAVGAGGTAAATGTIGTAAAALVAFLAPLAAIAAVATGVIAALQEVVIYLGKFAGLNLEWSGSLTGLWKESTKAAESTKRLEDAEKRRAMSSEQIARRNERFVENDARVRAVGAMQSQLDAAGRVSRGLDSRESFSDERQQVLRDIAAASGQVQQEQAARMADKAAGRAQAGAGEDLARQRLVEQSQRLLELDQQRVGVLRDQKDAAEQALATAKQAAQAAEQQVKAEQDGYKRKLAQLGQLTAAEQARAKAIAENVRTGGEINRSDAKFLQSVGLGDKLTTDFYANEAAATGGAQTLQALGERDGLAKAETDAAKAATDVAAAELALQSTTSQLNDAMQVLQQTITAAATRINDSLKLQQELQGRGNEASPTVRNPIGQAGGDATAFPVDDQIKQIEGMKVAAQKANAELTAAMVGALDAIRADAENAAAEINRRRTAGALTMQAVG